MTIKFGTDGWRAVISDTFTFYNLRVLSQAIADLVREQNGDAEPHVVVGFDTRFLSDRYAHEVARVEELAAAGAAAAALVPDVGLDAARERVDERQLLEGDLFGDAQGVVEAVPGSAGGLPLAARTAHRSPRSGSPG